MATRAKEAEAEALRARMSQSCPAAVPTSAAFGEVRGKEVDRRRTVAKAFQKAALASRRHFAVQSAGDGKV